jgi:hypothetical protein
MDFARYPFDVQECSVKLGAIMETASEIAFSGSLDYDTKYQRALQYEVPVEFDLFIDRPNVLHVPFVKVSVSPLRPEDTELVYEGDSFSVTGFTVLLQRQMIPFLLQFFLPSTMFVMISWISFVIPHNSGERTGMIVTLLLVVVSMYLAVVSMCPKGFHEWH